MPNDRRNAQDGPRSVARRDFVRSAALVAAGFAAAGRVDAATAGEPSQGAGRVREFIRKVQNARLFDLASVWDENSPIASVNPTYSMELNRTHAGTRGQFGDGGKLSFTSEVQHWSGQHGAPSIDAIGHIGHNGLLFGGIDAAAATADLRGIGRSGVGAHLDMAHYPTDLLVNRGVLLDVARFVNGNLTPLPPQFEITARHLARTAKAQRVELERGDTVLIRTGWGQYFGANPALYKGDFSPGPGVEGAQFLIDAGARVVGNDTLTFEQRPRSSEPRGRRRSRCSPCTCCSSPTTGSTSSRTFSWKSWPRRASTSSCSSCRRSRSGAAPAPLFARSPSRRGPRTTSGVSAGRGPVGRSSRHPRAREPARERRADLARRDLRAQGEHSVPNRALRSRDAWARHVCGRRRGRLPP